MSVPLCLPWKSSPFWHNGGWMCIIAFTAIYSWRKEAHPTPTLLPFLIFFLKKNLGHMPQRNVKCFNSFAPFLSGCHLQGFSLCPEVICSGWTIKAIMVAACFPIMRRDDWQQRDGAGVEGHLASIYLIWKHFFLFIGIHSCNKTQTNWSDYVLEISGLKTSHPILYITFFNYLSHLPGQSDCGPQLGDTGQRMPAM